MSNRQFVLSLKALVIAVCLAWQAKRTLATDAASSAAYASAIGKEQAHAPSHLADGDDALAALVAEQGVPVASKVPAMPTAQPAASTALVMPHAFYMRSLDTMPRLLNGNIFPYASYVNNQRYTYNKHSFVSEKLAYPWTEESNRTPVNRNHFHRQNELGEYVARAAHLGLKPFGSEKR